MSRPEPFNMQYYTLDIEHTDHRLPKFIEAMQKSQRVSFSGDVYFILHIHLQPKRARLVLTKTT